MATMRPKAFGSMRWFLLASNLSQAKERASAPLGRDEREEMAVTLSYLDVDQT
jgi:hypothetical protein